MDTLLGILGVAAWIAAVIVIAAVITWVVVKLFPAEKETTPTPDDEGTAA